MGRAVARIRHTRCGLRQLPEALTQLALLLCSPINVFPV
jgi:hypothetical protein